MSVESISNATRKHPLESNGSWNPFSTRFTRPSAVEFVFSNGDSAPQLIREFAELNDRAQIIGEHGSGKSTLLMTLAASMRGAGAEMRFVQIRGTETDTAARFDLQRIGILDAALTGEMVEDRASLAMPDRLILLIDGFDSLPAIQRWMILAYTRLQRWGLLVTTHQPVYGLRTLRRLQPDLALVERLAASLQHSAHCPLSDQVVAGAYRRARGNVRETWFDLYDAFAQQSHA